MTQDQAASTRARLLNIAKADNTGLTEEFASDPTRQKLWEAFLRKNDIEPIPLSKTVSLIKEFFEKIISARNP